MEEVIVDDLLDKIGKGVFTTGELLPSEHALSRRFNVSRLIVRKAYNQLEERGYIRTHRGKGRFLSQRKQHVHLDLRSDIGFTEKLKAMGVDLVTHNLGAEPISFESELWETLGAEMEETVYSVALMRIVYNEPIAIHTSFLRERLFPAVEEMGSEISSMYSFFSDHGYTNFDSVNTAMNVTLPTLSEQDRLGCPYLVPLVSLEYTTTAWGTEVIQHNKIVYRSDRFRYIV